VRLLDAAIAFAICIAGLATLVTVMVEMLHQILRMRARGLRETLEAVFTDVLLPKAQRTFAKSDKALRSEMARWLAEMRASPLKGTALARWYPGILSSATSLSTEEFLKRIADTEPFKKLQVAAAQRADELLAEFARKYEEYGGAMSEYFRRRAQTLSLMAGVLLALCANIDGLRLFERFLSDPAIAAKMEAQSAELQKVLARVEAGKGGNVPMLAEVRQNSDDASRLVAGYQEMQLPIGWAFYPMCSAPAGKAGVKVDPRCSVQTDWRAQVSWLFAVIMTGLLVGLGGPFWFDVAKKLASFRDAMRSGQGQQAGTPTRAAGRGAGA